MGVKYSFEDDTNRKGKNSIDVDLTFTFDRPVDEDESRCCCDRDDGVKMTRKVLMRDRQCTNLTRVWRTGEDEISYLVFPDCSRIESNKNTF